MAKVGIVMGSDSDMPIMSKAAAILDKLGIDYEMKIISAHREPDVFFEYAKTAEEKGFKVIIAWRLVPPPETSTPTFNIRSLPFLRSQYVQPRMGYLLLL